MTALVALTAVLLILLGLALAGSVLALLRWPLRQIDDPLQAVHGDQPDLPRAARNTPEQDLAPVSPDVALRRMTGGGGDVASCAAAARPVRARWP